MHLERSRVTLAWPLSRGMGGKKEKVGYKSKPSSIREPWLNPTSVRDLPLDLELENLPESPFLYLNKVNIKMFMSMFFLLEDNCFAMLCWLLPYNDANQP